MPGLAGQSHAAVTVRYYTKRDSDGIGSTLRTDCQQMLPYRGIPSPATPQPGCQPGRAAVTVPGARPRRARGRMACPAGPGPAALNFGSFGTRSGQIWTGRNGSAARGRRGLVRVSPRRGIRVRLRKFDSGPAAVALRT
eukprot:130450-Hanusia_phi.AAC.2